MFRNDDRRYVVPVSQCVDDPGGSLVTGAQGARPSAPNLNEALLGGVIGIVESDVVDCQVVNVGDEAATDRVVRVIDGDGSEMDRTTVSLDSLGHSTVSLDSLREPVTLDIGDEQDTQVPPS